MRGDLKKELRRKNLLLLREKYGYTWVEIANKSNVSHPYLSQIANQNIQKKGVSPRALSDNYAEMIEKGLGLPTGWMDVDHSSENEHLHYDSDLSSIREPTGEPYPATRNNLSYSTTRVKALTLVANLPEHELGIIVYIIESLMEKYKN